MSSFVTDEGMRVAGILQQMLMNMQQLEKLVTGVDRQVDPNLSVPPFRVVSVDGI